MAETFNPGHPGVYIQELPATPTVQGVATSIPVFIGRTQALDAADANVARRVNGWADYQARYGGYVWGSYVSSAVYEFFAEGGAVCYVISVAGATPANTASKAITDTATGVKYTVWAASPGTWGNLLQIAIVDGLKQGTSASNYFQINVQVAAADLAETAKGGSSVARRLIMQYISDNSIAPIGDNYVLESFGLFTDSSVGAGGRQCKLATKINAESIFIQIVDVTPSKTKQRAVRAAKSDYLGGGVDNSSDYTQATWDQLASVPQASLVATPDAAVVDMTTDKTDALTYKKGTVVNGVMANIYKKDLQNLFYVIDSPYAGPCVYKLNKLVDNSQFISDFVLGNLGDNDNIPLNYENAAVYYPWPVVYNPISKTSLAIPPSGPVLGCYARTDLTAGVYVSPAGVINGHLRTATGMTKSLTEGDQDIFNPLGINVIRPIAGYGYTVYGARTCAVQGQWQYVAVRRFVTFVEQSLKAALQWVVFQPNSELLWSIVGLEVSAFLMTLWQEGALFGSSAAEAFFVTCDTTNNPPSSRMAGVLYVDVGLAVVYPAEFIVLRIAQKTSSTSSAS